jgi:uncharacterized NAD(P)/FAD-binding protein YdhS
MPHLGDFDIGIIGNGLSGHLVLKWLLEMNPSVKIALFNGSAYLPIEGPAYLKNSETDFFLNTPSNKIALSEENGYEFCEFLSLSDENRDWHFAARSDYGRYAKTKLAPFSSLATSFTEALAITRSNSQFSIEVEEGEIGCTQILLATGNDFSCPWNGVIKNPWQFDFSILKPNDEVLVIGTGLTMFDVLGAISDSKKPIRITAISKSGLMHAVHPLNVSPPILFDWDSESRMSLQAIFRQLRRNIAVSNGEWWRAIDGLRPVTIALWEQLSIFEKRQFINHLLSKWNMVRHRAPIQVYDKVLNQLNGGSLSILKGKVEQASANFVKLSDGQILKADYVFYAGGAISDPLKSESLLWKQLAKESWVATHECGLGLQATPQFNLVGKDGIEVLGAYTIGNTMRGVMLECTAIPDLKVHAKLVAEQLLKNNPNR